MTERQFKTLRRAALLALLTALLTACSPAGPSDVPAFVFPGRGQGEAAVLLEQAERMFAAVAACADAEGVRPEGVEVRLIVPGQPWHCPPGTGGCIYDSARRIDALDWRADPAFSESFGHECVHLARWLKTGDIDQKHTGPWWVNGKACQVEAGR